MVRPSLAVAFVPTTLLVILLSSLSARRADAQRAADGILVLNNALWDSVRVELRIGPSTDCVANPTVDVRALHRNDRWAIVAPGNVVCWRREQSPGDATTTWSAWGQARVAADSLRNVSL